MVKIGDYNRLPVSRVVDFGVYLDGGNGVEILLPARYVEGVPHKGDEIEVFVYTDSEDRLIATTEHPFVKVGQFAFLQVVSVNRIGAFLDWGLPKDLLVPFREQKVRMSEGRQYLVYVYLDDVSKRVAASVKIDKFLGNVIPQYRKGDKVKAMVYGHGELGYRVIVDNLHHGMIYDNEVFRPIEIGSTIDAYVKNVRDDGKIDVTLSDKAVNRIAELSERLIDYISASGGKTDLCDASSPEEIKMRMHCSKKDFKRAVGLLLKERKIVLTEGGISLFAQNR